VLKHRNLYIMMILSIVMFLCGYYSNREQDFCPNHKNLDTSLRDGVSSPHQSGLGMEVRSKASVGNYNAAPLLRYIDICSQGYPSEEEYQNFGETTTVKDDANLRASDIHILHSSEFSKFLISALQNNDPFVRETAVERMLETETSEKKYDKYLRDLLLLEKDENVLSQAIDYFKFYSGDEQEILDVSSALLQRSDLPSEIVEPITSLLISYGIDQNTTESIVLTSVAFHTLDWIDSENIRNMIADPSASEAAF